MPNSISASHIKHTPTRFIITGTIVLSGNYVQAANGGEVLNFANAVLPIGFVLPNFSGPDYLSILGNAGYSYGAFVAIPQAYPSQFLVPISVKTASAGGPTSTELSAGAYPASVTGDTITFEAHFRKMC